MMVTQMRQLQLPLLRTSWNNIMTNRRSTLLALATLIGSTGLPVVAQEGMRAGLQSTGKPYTITVGLRQEYDDNIFTSSTNEQASMKTIVNPGFVFNYPMEMTTISFNYSMGVTLFWDRPGDDVDLSHQFTARVSHKFSERFSIDMRDQFRFAQEAEGRDGTSIQRFLGDGFTNTFTMDISAQWTERFSTITGYGNVIERYDDPTVNLINDQMTHQARQDFRFSVLPSTTAVAAYNYETTDYTDGNPLNTRDFDRHRLTGGADHYLLENWLLTGRVGGEFVLYENDQLDDSVNPYVDLSTAWTYLPGSRVRASYNYATNLTDDGFSGSSEGHTLRLSIDHAITKKLTAGANVRSQFQTQKRSTSLGAASDEEIEENSVSAGLTLNYTINNYLSANAGYIYSMVYSEDAIREYDRNQIYIGITGKY